MIRCRNGHLNEDGATYCAVCKVYIDATADTVEPDTAETVEPKPEERPTEQWPAPEPARPLVTLSDTALTVAPGGTASAELGVQNPGKTSDEYAISVEGPGAPWLFVDPTTLAVAPGDRGVAEVVAHPDASAAAPGSVAFAVRVASRRRPDLSASAQGTLELARPEARPAPRPTPWLRWLAIAAVVVALAVGAAFVATRTTGDGGTGGDDGGAKIVGTARVDANVREFVPDDLSSTSGIVRSLPAGSEVEISCQVTASSGHWDRIAAPADLEGKFVNDRLLEREDDPEPC